MIVILRDTATMRTLQELLRAGADGYVLKQSAASGCCRPFGATT